MLDNIVIARENIKVRNGGSSNRFRRSLYCKIKRKCDATCEDEVFPGHVPSYLSHNRMSISEYELVIGKTIYQGYDPNQTCLQMRKVSCGSVKRLWRFAEAQKRKRGLRASCSGKQGCSSCHESIG
jgi:hypothetical protein